MKTKKPCWDDLPKNYAMKSHGHVTKHPDGRLALDIIEAIGGDRKFWSETQKESVGKVQQMLIDSAVTNHAKE